jgi:uncharacterized DUF497 family protein
MLQIILKVRNDIVGGSDRGRLLIVSYTERGDAVRLISAREVTQTKREGYEQG